MSGRDLGASVRLLTAWRAPLARPTMDIDLAGKTSNELEHIRSLVGEVSIFGCVQPRKKRDVVVVLEAAVEESEDGPFDGDLLAEAIRSTFRHRGTAIDAMPIGLTEAFISDLARAVQWRALVRRSRFDSEFGLDEIVEQVRRFASAPLSANRRGGPIPSPVDACRTVGVNSAPAPKPE